MRKKIERKELILEQADQLRAMKLPKEWEVSKLEVHFTRPGILGEWATVIYDDRNNTFYVQTNKSIVYPDDVQAMQEAIDVMKRANNIIKN